MGVVGSAQPEISPELRSMLESIAKPAILLSREYVILAANDAYAKHYGKVPQLGHDRCFVVSHGYDSPCDENQEECPLRNALATKSSQRVFHVHHHESGPEHVDVELQPMFDDAGEVSCFVEIITPFEQASAHSRGTFVGRSRAFGSMLELLQRGAPSEVPILLLGESGTGKELAARAVHEASARRGGTFVPVECTGLGENLFESQLFGHAKGAFTGAHERRPGLVEAARGGTLFLDEIGDVPLSLQVKLLRLLESGTYRPVGDVNPRRADFRLVCATHRDLAAMVERGDFRQDLYYRINAFPIELPPLRKRSEDLELLCAAMLRSSHKRVSPAALGLLQRYPFPGNVRELRNILDRAVLLADGDAIEPRHLPSHVSGAEPTDEGGWPWGAQLLPLEEVERRYLLWASEMHEGDRRELAERLGLSERTLYRKLQTLRDDD